MNKWDIRALEQFMEEFEDEVVIYLSLVAVGLGLALIISELIGR